jgi:uncharacterized repeat protein (TIGR01451 family)/fimbrial isopeptide formation D2 family protein
LRVVASIGALALIATILGGTTVLTASPDAAQAAPGNPGTPSAPAVLYTEDFQNGSGVTTLPNYTSTSGVKYTADAYWLSTGDCNGFILSAADTTRPSGYCNNFAGFSDGEYAAALRKAQALGLLNSPQNPDTNRALSTNTSPQTSGGTAPANRIEFATAGQINLPSANGRFITFSVDAAATGCNLEPPLLRFYFRDAQGVETPVSTSAINPCTDPGTQTSNGVFYGRFPANSSRLLSGSSVGIVLRNESSAAQNGNDGAIDNIRVLDVTPQLDKQFSPAQVQTGGTSTLTFTVTNTSELGQKNGWSFTDNLPSGLTLANSTVGGTCDADTAATAGGTSIAVTNGNLAVGETSCTITVQVTSPTAGSFTNGPDNVTTVGLTPPGDTTVTFSDPSYTVAKTASETVASPGDTVTYTVTVKNTGQWDYTAANPATFTDDLSKVLDDATYNNDATGGATITGNTLSWSGALAAGATQTITYSVKIDNPDTGDKILTNVVTPNTTGGTCLTEASCTTTTPVQSYEVTKTADRTDVVPGQTVTYTVTVKNTGSVAYTSAAPASFEDSLSNVLDDATYNNDASNGATYNAPTLSWKGALAVGATETITYSVTVNDPDTGDKHLDNTVVTPTGNCVEGSNDPACTVNLPAGTYTVSKTASTDAVTVGGEVTYKVVVTNTGERDYTDENPASFEDDLSKVLDDAKVTTGPDNGATISGNTLSWSGPLAIGASKTITYTVTVDIPDNGDKVLKNAVSPTGPGGSCDPDETCATTTNVRQFTTTKTSSPSGTVHPGDKVTYTVTVTNTGTAGFTAGTPASFTDNLSKVLDDATITDGPDQGATIDGNTLSWSGPLAVGATVKVTYVATVNTPDTGNKILTNAVTPDTPGGSCVSEASCTTTNPVGTYSVEKTSSASDGPVHEGDTVTYTVTVKNTGEAAYTADDPAVINDDLSKVLDDATYVAGSATNGAKVTGTELTWSGPLEVGGTQTITYKVKVGPAGTGDGTLTNVVAPPPGHGGECVTEADCTTTNLLQAFTMTKTADRTEVVPGQKVTYTIVVKNTGQADYTAAAPIEISDSLSEVLDDATYNNDATNGATYAAPKLSWTGPLAAGDTETITYSVTVNDPDTGDKQLRNAVVSTTPGTNCLPDSGDPACTSVVPAGSYTVAKTADTTSTTPGGKVTYTVTVTNTGKVAYTADNPASFRDDLTNVLDDATYNKDATQGAKVDGNTLTWAGPLNVGQTVKVTYSVTVNDPDSGNHDLVNAVVPTTVGGGCDPDGSCMTHTPVSSYTVTKQVSTTASVKPGAKVGYTITVKNTGETAYTTENPAKFDDNMSDVLDDATYNNDATHGAVLQGTTLRWAGPLKVGQTITVTYSVTVKAAGSGNGALRNTVDPTVDGGTCDPSGSCVTGTPIQAGPTPPGPAPIIPGLAFTGTELVGPGIGIALMLLALGGGLLIVRRRRQNGDEVDNA